MAVPDDGGHPVAGDVTLPTGPVATCAGWTTSVVKVPVMPDICRPEVTLTALVPLATSASVVSICRTFKLASRPEYVISGSDAS